MRRLRRLIWRTCTNSVCKQKPQTRMDTGFLEDLAIYSRTRNPSLIMILQACTNGRLALLSRRCEELPRATAIAALQPSVANH